MENRGIGAKIKVGNAEKPIHLIDANSSTSER